MKSSHSRMHDFSDSRFHGISCFTSLSGMAVLPKVMFVKSAISSYILGTKLGFFTCLMLHNDTVEIAVGRGMTLMTHMSQYRNSLTALSVATRIPLPTAISAVSLCAFTSPTREGRMEMFSDCRSSCEPHTVKTAPSTTTQILSST